MSTALLNCPKCGQPVPADAPGLLCPRCLVGGGFSESKFAPAQSNDPESTLHIVIPEDSTLPHGAPRKLGKYELVQEIASGGMGIVYKAWQPGLERFVAIKTIRSGLLATSADVERFQREAKAAAKLRHPNIVTIHEIGEQDGQHYFAMDYVPGENLATLARQQPFLPDQAAQITAAVANAIHYAHQQNVLHRDLKPANVILSPDGPRVLDFGLARLQQDDSQLTQTGTPMGSPCYMSPEQAGGKRGSVGAWSDVYALGALLYELLTGRPPFQGASVVETLHLVQETDPVPPSRLNPALPADVETICLKCLEKEPANRYQSAQELAEELGRFGRDEPIRARPVSAPEKAWRWCRRNPWVASLSASLALVFAAGLIGVLWQWRQAQRNAVAERNAKAETQRALTETRRLLYAADMTQAHQIWNGGDIPRATRLLEAHRPKPGEEDLRSFEWRYLWQRCQGDQLLTLRAHTNEVIAVALSPDGRTLASGSGDGKVKLWDTASGRELATVQTVGDWVRSIAFSADGRLLATGGDVGARGKVMLWDVSSYQLIASNTNLESQVLAVSFASEGKTLATISGWGKMRLLAVPDLQEVVTLTLINDVTTFGAPTFLASAAFSPDGKQLTWSEADGTLKLRDIPGMSEPTIIPVNQFLGMPSLVFSPDGKKVAAACLAGVVKVWDTTTMTFASTARLPSRLSAVAISPDGKTLAGGAFSGIITVWDATTLEPIRTLRGHGATVNGLVFSPDNQTLFSASQDRTVKVWKLGEKMDFDTLRGHTMNVWSVSFAPDNGTLASGSWDKTVRLWDGLTGQLKALLTGHKYRIFQVAFSPDGKHLTSVGSDELSGTGDGEVLLWDVATQKLLGTIAETNQVTCAAFSSDGKTLATGGADGKARIWSLVPGQVVATVEPTNGVVAVDFSPDGKTLITAGKDHVIRLWHLASLREIASLVGHSGFVSSMICSRDGSTLATAGDDRTVKIWNLDTHKEKASLQGHRDRVSQVAFAPDGKTLASCSFDGTVKIWSLVTYREVTTFDPQSGSIPSVEFSKDGKILAAGSSAGDRVVRLWRAPSLEEIAKIETANAERGEKEK